MANVEIKGPDSTSVALTTSYLGNDDDINVSGCDTVELWFDDDTIAGDIKYTVTNSDNGDELTVPLAAGNHWLVYLGDGVEATFDAKADSGTPNLQIASGLIARD